MLIGKVDYKGQDKFPLKSDLEGCDEKSNQSCRCMSDTNAFAAILRNFERFGTYLEKYQYCLPASNIVSKLTASERFFTSLLRPDRSVD